MIITITGGKGGAGKSLVSTSLAVEFAKSRRTMLVDADVECPNDHLLLSIKRKKHADVYQPIPKWDLKKCTKCGKCAKVCKQNSIVFAKGKYPAFLKDLCIGCKACIVACPVNAITEAKKQIGTIYKGKNYGVNLVSGELKLGELASGEIVSELRMHAEQINKSVKADIMLIDSPAGTGCPVIASMTGADYIIAVTEPTPSALHDLKRVLHLARHFNIKHSIIINKFDLGTFSSKIQSFANKQNINVIGKIPYRKDFLNATIKMKPIFEINQQYNEIFKSIINNILTSYS